MKKLLLILLFILLNKNSERFVCSQNVWNNATRNTRNMSYDLRCTPYIEPEFVNFQYPSNFPNNYGKCINI